MPWNVQLSQDREYIGIRYYGTVTSDELTEALIAASTLAHSTKEYRFFADCSEMTGGHSIVDLYDLIRKYETNGISRIMREAVLLPQTPEAVPEVQFYETASFNNGYNVKLFSVREEALAWLCTKST
jgi:hypothetical protein